MTRSPGLAATAALAFTLYLGWTGFRLGPIEWNGVWALIGGTWLWDLRWPLLPGYVVLVLGVAEWVAARLGAAR